MRTIRFALLILLTLLAGCASPGPVTVRVPENLIPSTEESLALVVPAKGVQIYECRARKDQAGAYEWVFVAPEAELFDANGKSIGRHFAGPHWEATDGSKIVGAVKSRAEAPAPGAIPWLLLSAKSVGAPGAFSKVTSIQRVDTVGGVPPPGGCYQIGSRAYMPYSADYYFFTGK